ncbi:DUF3800 domain-containing protein [Vagococcus sp.]|uniref:DUF3800 domain-containing protein n=1 Tax=Vagococcus sp. TaxID=1933889 RepID=UPI003F9720BA
MKKYTLYLDESNAFDAVSGNSVLCVAGIIIPESLELTIKAELNEIKRAHFGKTSITFHEKEIREVNNRRTKHPKVEEFMYYRSKGHCRDLYLRLGHIIKSNNLKVVGVCIDTNQLKKFYKTTQKIDGYRSAIELLMQNFTQFLLINDAVGKIILEGRSLDSTVENSADLLVKSKYYFVKAIGTTIIPANDIQSRLTGIQFLRKTDNNTGLQLADFIPNNFARQRVGLKRHTINMMDILEQQLYDGYVNDIKRFGMIQLP